jgi:DNA-binding MarR family transcriptional regulator
MCNNNGATMSTPATTPTTVRLSERELRAWRGLLRAHAALTKALDAELEAAHALPLTSYEVLLHLADAEAESMRMCDLAESVILSRSGLTRLIDRLERDGFVERRSCSHDARGSYAVLTAAGRAKLLDARGTHLAGVRTLFLERFSEAELDMLGEAWERVQAGLGEDPGRSDGGC